MGKTLDQLLLWRLSRRYKDTAVPSIAEQERRLKAARKNRKKS